jgi:sporulation protein YlmC with PRC-barrel domain
MTAVKAQGRRRHIQDLRGGAHAGWTRRQDMAVALVEVDVAVVAEAARASKLIGAKVENDAEEKVGTIDDLMLVGDTVEFAILSVGGFLDLDAKLVAISFDDLQIEGDSVILPDATRDELKRLPEFRYR